MTTISTAPPFDMEFLQPDDTMELASSPHTPQDDFDLDLDTMHEPDVAPEDSMVEDSFDDGQLDVTDQFDDDEMVDEDTAVHHFPDNASDLHMDAHHDLETALEDEDILYEDDEVTKDSEFVQPGTGSEPHRTQQPFGVSDDLKVSGTHNEDELAFPEQDNKEQISVASQSRIGEIAEDFHEQPLEDEPQDDIRAKDAFEDGNDAMPGAHADEHGEEHLFRKHNHTTKEHGLDLQDSITITNPIDPAEAVQETEFTHQDTEHPSTTTEDAAIEQHSYKPGTQNVALHTVKVIYQDSEICLFPPQNDDNAETFFLSESSLAHGSIDKLLASCRDVLADTIGDDDELVLDVASLGLHISEGSKYAAEITLSQILDVYLTLSHNENIEQIEPLYCNLSSRVCLASQYAYLAASAQEGKTITEITAEHIDSPEIEEFGVQEEHVEQLVEDSATHYDPTEINLPPPEPSGLEYAEPDEGAADLVANDITGNRADEHLNAPRTNKNPKAFHNQDNEGNTDIDHLEEAKAVDPWTASTESAIPDDAGIQPDQTEYQEDIDEVADDNHKESGQEQLATDEHHYDALSANNETASSGTVEAEVGDHQEEYFEEIVEQNDIHFEPFVVGDENRDGSDASEAQQGEFLQIIEHPSNGAGPSQLQEDNADDILDLAEDQERPPTNGTDHTAEPEAKEFEDLEESEDLFAEADASTDQTLNNNHGEAAEEDDLDVYEPPATPAKTGSAKRKVEADDEDDYDLLDTETPDKKRRRPS